MVKTGTQYMTLLEQGLVLKQDPMLKSFLTSYVKKEEQIRNGFVMPFSQGLRKRAQILKLKWVLKKAIQIKLKVLELPYPKQNQYKKIMELGMDENLD